MKLTTTKIIELLPFDQGFRKELLESLPTLPIDTRLDIVDLLWDEYADFYEALLEVNIKIAIGNVANGSDTFDKEFYKRIKEKTEKDIQNQATQEEATTDLSNARTELEKLLKTSN